jgi:hypothetical protein
MNNMNEKINEIEIKINQLKKELSILKIIDRFDKLTILDFRLNPHNQIKGNKQYTHYTIELKKSFVSVLGRFKMSIYKHEYENIGSPEVRAVMIKRYKDKFLNQYKTI